MRQKAIRHHAVRSFATGCEGVWIQLRHPPHFNRVSPTTSSRGLAELRATTLLLVVVSAISLSACKDPVQPQDRSHLEILSFVVSPSGLQFSLEDGIRDSTIDVTMELRLTPASSFEQGALVVRRDEETVYSLQLDPSNGVGPYVGQFTFIASTIKPDRLEITAMLVGATGNVVTARHSLLISTFATQPPVLDSVSNPDTVLIPGQGQTSVRFEAKAYHPVSQALMDGVFLYLSYDNNGQSVEIRNGGADFRLHDDGLSDPSTGRDDRTAADSVYTLLFYVNSGNSPEEYRVHWYARDLSGLYSDTLVSPLSIVNP